MTDSLKKVVRVSFFWQKSFPATFLSDLTGTAQSSGSTGSCGQALGQHLLVNGHYSPDVLLSQLQRFIFGYLFELTAVAAGFGRLEGAGVVVAVFHSVSLRCASSEYQGESQEESQGESQRVDGEIRCKQR